MALALVVTQPFADYVLGDRITDADTIKTTLADHSHRVVKISVDDQAPTTPPHPAQEL